MVLGWFWEGFWDDFSMIFCNSFEKRDFVKICILPRKNHYFQAFEFLKTNKKNDTNLIKN